jgi:uncharacterized membrane protein YfcA
MDITTARFAALALVVAGAFAVESAIGFGATVLAVTFGVHLYPLGTLLPVLVPLGLVLSATNAWRLRAHTDRRLLLRGILPVMGVGVAIGLAVFERAPNDALRRAYGVFVMAVAVSELRSSAGAARPLLPLARLRPSSRPA